MLIEWTDQISNSSQLEAIDRAAMFGDGFFTTGVIKSGKLQHKDYHLKRIELSAKQLQFHHVEMNTISDHIETACIKQPNSIIRINFTRLQTQRGYAIDKDSVIKVSFILSPRPARTSEFCTLIDSNVPISSNPLLAGLKHLNRLDSVLAASQLTDNNSEALMYHQDFLVCGSKSNVFLYIDGLWHTPKLSHAGVAGIMRQNVLDGMEKNNQLYRITDIKRSHLVKVKSAFITNCVIGFQIVDRINETLIDTELSHKLKQQLSL